MKTRDEMLSMIKEGDKEAVGELLSMNLQNWSNYEFVSKCLSKYLKKFPLEDEAVCEQIFELACRVGHKKTAVYMMKKNKAKACYYLLSSAPEPLFQLLSTVRTDELAGEEEQAYLLEAAAFHKGKERLTQMKQWGFSLSVKNTEGQTITDLLSERIRLNAYEKNKSGRLKRQHDRNMITYIDALISDPERFEKKKKIDKKTKIAVGILAVIILVTAFVIGYDAYKEHKADSATTTDVDSMDSTDISSESDADSYNADESLVVADGDTVNIDYVGTIDGVEFAGGNTEGAGTQLVIGSNSYIDDFEEQLIGHHVGETVMVEVTFPEDYGQDELNGKDAVFTVTINGIYE